MYPQAAFPSLGRLQSMHSHEFERMPDDVRGFGKIVSRLGSKAARPYESCKKIQGLAPERCPWKLVQLWYKSCSIRKEWWAN